MQEMQIQSWVWSLGREDPLEEGMATHSSILAWRIPWTKGLLHITLVHPNPVPHTAKTALPLTRSVRGGTRAESCDVTLTAAPGLLPMLIHWLENSRPVSHSTVQGASDHVTSGFQLCAASLKGKNPRITSILGHNCLLFYPLITTNTY